MNKRDIKRAAQDMLIDAIQVKVEYCEIQGFENDERELIIQLKKQAQRVGRLFGYYSIRCDRVVPPISS